MREGMKLTAAALGRDPHGVKHGQHGERELYPGARAPTHVHAKPVPIRVEDLVRLQERRDARAGGAREELQERREVLCAHALGGERRVAQTVRRGARRRRGEEQPWQVPCWGKGARWGGRMVRVHAPERRAE